MVRLGIIGGSGLNKPGMIDHCEDKSIETIYGYSSAPLRVGDIDGLEVAFLARHGKDHEIPPTQINYRANIKALQEYGCTHIIATTACGSLREEIKRGDLVILDQFIDFTRLRALSFFDAFAGGTENAKHTAMPWPFNDDLRNILIESASEINFRFHERGTVITIEGPRFSTVAESKMFRIWGADIINMSIAPEAILANEAGIPYAAVAMSTDYDSWKTDEKPVTWEEIYTVFNENIEKVTKLLLLTIKKIKQNF